MFIKVCYHANKIIEITTLYYFLFCLKAEN